MKRLLFFAITFISIGVKAQVTRISINAVPDNQSLHTMTEPKRAVVLLTLRTILTDTAGAVLSSTPENRFYYYIPGLFASGGTGGMNSMVLAQQLKNDYIIQRANGAFTTLQVLNSINNIIDVSDSLRTQYGVFKGRLVQAQLDSIKNVITANPSKYLTGSDLHAAGSLIYDVPSHTFSYTAPTKLSQFTNDIPLATVASVSDEVTARRAADIGFSSRITGDSVRTIANTTNIATLQGRNINAGYGLTGGGNLIADRILQADTAGALVSKTRLSANLTGYYKASNPAGYISSYTETDPLYSANGVPKTRTVNGLPLSANVTLNTDNVAEGTTNQYFTSARARAALSAGYGWLYSNTTGVGTVDTASTTGIVSKSRLAATLAGYVRGVTLSTGSASFTSSSLLAGSTTVVTVTLSTPFTDSNYQVGSPLIFGSGGVSLLGGTFTLVSVVKNPTTVVVTLKNNALLSLAVSGTVDIVALKVSN